MMLLLFSFVLLTMLLVWFKFRQLAIIAFFVSLGAGTGFFLRLMTSSLHLSF